jgi:predicted metal-dependent enzyme (double-stranded beta helix superfamily)
MTTTSHSPVSLIPPPLALFVQGVEALLFLPQDEATGLSRIGELMRSLVSRDDWLDPALAQPHPQYYQQYLLYADPQDRFSVVSFIFGPGQSTPIHDHTVWGVIGMLQGCESTQHYELGADDVARPLGVPAILHPGEVTFVSPRIGDLHQVRNTLTNDVAISIHVYGGNIGKIQRHVFYPAGGRKHFVSGYSNLTTPSC